jgi:hypothetical protein
MPHVGTEPAFALLAGWICCLKGQPADPTFASLLALQNSDIKTAVKAD